MKRFRMIGVSLVILATLTAVVALALTMFVPAVQAQPGGTEVFHGRVHPVRGASPQAVTNSLMTYHGGPISLRAQRSTSTSGAPSGTPDSRPVATRAPRRRPTSMASSATSAAAPGTRSTSSIARESRLARPIAAPAEQHVGNPDRPARGYLGGYHLASQAHHPVQHRQRRDPADEPLCGYNANAIYFVFTPSGHSMSGFGTQWCAWHDNTNTSGGPDRLRLHPYMPRRWHELWHELRQRHEQQLWQWLFRRLLHHRWSRVDRG